MSCQQCYIVKKFGVPYVVTGQNSAWTCCVGSSCNQLDVPNNSPDSTTACKTCFSTYVQLLTQLVACSCTTGSIYYPIIACQLGSNFSLIYTVIVNCLKASLSQTGFYHLTSSSEQAEAPLVQ